MSQTVNERMRELRLSLGLTQAEFGARVGLKQAVIGQMETGARNLTARNFDLICEKFSVNPDWLRSGTGAVHVETKTSTFDTLCIEKNLTMQEKSMLRAFLSLSPEGRAGVAAYYKAIVQDAILHYEEIQNFISTPTQDASLDNSNVNSSVVSPQSNYNDLYTNPLINQHRCIPNASDKAIPDEKNA